MNYFRESKETMLIVAPCTNDRIKYLCSYMCVVNKMFNKLHQMAVAFFAAQKTIRQLIFDWLVRTKKYIYISLTNEMERCHVAFLGVLIVLLTIG